MRANTIPFLLAAVFAVYGSGACHAQAQQYLLDTITEGTGGMYPTSTTATSDGGTILHLISFLGETDRLWKMDDMGEPIWCKQYGISSEHRARMPDGGLVFCEVTGYSADGDHIQIVRTDAQGEVIWSKMLTLQDPYVTFFNNGWLYSTTNDEGDCLITMSEIGGSAYQWFYCLDADGELLWSRNFLFNPNAEHVEHICSDGLGGWFFGSYDWGASVFRLGRLNTFGDMAWYKSYAVPFPQEFWLGGLCSLGFAPVVVGGYEMVFEEDYRWFVMRLNLNGTLDWFRVSTTPQSAMGRCEATNAGELIVSCGNSGIPYCLARLSGTGEVVSSFQPEMLSVVGIACSHYFVDWDHFDTTLTLGDVVVTYPDTALFPPNQPAVWRLPITDMSACGAEAIDLSSVLASNSAVAVQDQPFSEVIVPYTLTDTLCSVTSFSPIGVSDYCAYFIGMGQNERPVSSLMIASTLLERGTPLTVSTPGEAFNIEVLDSHGRLSYRGRIVPNGTILIPTSSWASGIYFVRSQPVAGGPPKVVKVVIE